MRTHISAASLTAGGGGLNAVTNVLPEEWCEDGCPLPLFTSLAAANTGTTGAACSRAVLNQVGAGCVDLGALLLPFPAFVNLPPLPLLLLLLLRDPFKTSPKLFSTRSLVT